MYLKVSLTLTRQGFGVKNILIQSSKNQYDLKPKNSWIIMKRFEFDQLIIPNSNKLKQEILFDDHGIVKSKPWFD